MADQKLSPVTMLSALYKQIASVIFCDKETLLLALTTLLCRGNVLLEDAPGLGKTTLAKTLAKSLDLDFKRLQCTPDLLPSDVTGINIFLQNEQEFQFIPGPIFTNILLVDEINRTSPRTQSALLEAMAEHTVTIDRKTHTLPDTFMVIATQNPVEFSGTYPLPEAQLDRFFMRLSLGYPTAEQEVRIMDMNQSSNNLAVLKPQLSETQLRALQALVHKIGVDDKVKRYIADIVRETRKHHHVRLGSSSRGSIALLHASKAYALLSNQKFVTPHIVQQLIKPVLGHRLIIKAGQTIDDKVLDEILSDVIAKVPVPALPTAG